MRHGPKRTAAQRAKAEVSYRKDVVDPIWLRQFKAAAHNGSIAELRGLEGILHRAIGRLEGFLADPDHYGT